MVHRLSALISIAAMGISLPLASLSAPAQAAQNTCPTPVLGRYAVMGMGVQSGSGRNTPTAHVLEERWLAGGKLQGTLVERVGRSERQATYTGVARMGPSCVLQLERKLPWGSERSEAVLDGKGRPLYSLNRNAGSVITSRWLPMAPGNCAAADLNGLVLSSQVGPLARGCMAAERRPRDKRSASPRALRPPGEACALAVVGARVICPLRTRFG
jgi:hypothetical protein